VDVQADPETGRVVVTLTELTGRKWKLRPTPQEARRIAQRLIQEAGQLTTKGDMD
jgi:hypothetical protein